MHRKRTEVRLAVRMELTAIVAAKAKITTTDGGRIIGEKDMAKMPHRLQVCRLPHRICHGLTRGRLVLLLITHRR